MPGALQPAPDPMKNDVSQSEVPPRVRFFRSVRLGCPQGLAGLHVLMYTFFDTKAIQQVALDQDSIRPDG
jgi:hypothetical protein